MATSRSFAQSQSLKLINFPIALSVLLILIGVLLIISVNFRALNLQSIYSGNDQNLVNSKGSQLQSKPTKIYIPSIAKVLEISDGQILNGRWTISDSGVSFLTSSAQPGTRGNSVIYGHNKQNILGSLPELQDGDVINIIMSDGEVFQYKVEKTAKIKPSQVEILNESQEPKLTLYTCAGFLDQARFVVFAKLIEVT